MQCYDCSHNLLDSICASLKKDEVVVQPMLHDKTGAYEYSAVFKRQLNHMAQKTGRFLNHDQIAALQIPNTLQSLSCYAWMSSYFELAGDKIPNKDEVHLETGTLTAIYEEVYHSTLKYPFIFELRCVIVQSVYRSS